MSAEPVLIAHVVYRFGLGGLENGIVNLINRMSHRRWRHVIVALTDVSHDFATRIERADVRYVALRKRPGHLLREYPRLYRVFKELRPAIVHTRNLAALEAVVPAWAARAPVRIHGEHGWDVQDPSGHRHRYRYMRMAYRPFVTGYVALSRHLADYLERQVGITDTVISQIYNGVDTGRFRGCTGTRPAIRGCPFGGDGQWLIGTVCRMEPIKDPLNLVHAFVRAHRLRPDAAKHLRLVLIGDGAMRPLVRAALEQAGLGDRAWFAGERSDVSDVMRGLDCFVLPSLAEGISNTILEAMATGLPIVATRVGGNAELIEAGLSGLLVPPADSNALAHAILEYFDNRAAARRHARTARRVVEARFSLHRMVADYERLYERALAAAGLAVPSDGPETSHGAVGAAPTRSSAH